MTEIDWFWRWGTSVFAENTAIFVIIIIINENFTRWLRMALLYCYFKFSILQMLNHACVLRKHVLNNLETLYVSCKKSHY